MTEVYSPLYNTTFTILSVCEDRSGNPLLICQNKEKGFNRMVFRPLEVSCEVPHMWKGKPVQFYRSVECIR